MRRPSLKVHNLAVGRGRCGTDTGYLVVRGLVVWALHRAVRVQASRPSKEALCGLGARIAPHQGSAPFRFRHAWVSNLRSDGVRLRRTPFEHARKEKVDLTRGASSQHDPQLFIDEGGGRSSQAVRSPSSRGRGDGSSLEELKWLDRPHPGRGSCI